MTKPKSRHATWAWMLWDWAEQPYPTIMQTFIFPVYLANAVATTAQMPDQAIAWALGIAGLVVAIIAPALGRRSDNNGRRKFWLVFNTFILVGITASSFFVEPKPEFFVLGLVLYGLGSVVQESAFVNYYAMLKGVTKESNIGRISGFAWALGYVGGIILLLICIVAFDPTSDVEGSINIRMIFIFAALWILVFSIPLMLFVPEIPKREKVQKESILQSWVNVFKDLSKLRKQAPETLKFLIASAIYRDGLAGVFSLGAVLGTYAFGFTTSSIIMYGVAANIVAAIGAIIGGWLDDRIGSRNIIVICLIGMVVSGGSLFVFSGLGALAYWIFGLLLSLFVGPAQASSRTFVSRFTPTGREGEVFGLYQLTGRAVSFLSPSLWGVFIGLAVALQQTTDPMKTTIYGIWGIVLILAVGLILLLRVHPRPAVID